jgi:uncharacterized membrane protein
MASYDHIQPDVQPTSLDRLIEGIAILAILLTIASIRNWTSLPDRIPANFDASGTPTVWRSPSFFLILPLISFALYAGMTFVARAPHRLNYPVPITPDNAVRQYRIALRMLRLIKAEILLLFAHIQYTTYNISQGSADGLGSWHLPLSLTVILGTVLGGLLIAKRPGHQTPMREENA